MPLFHEQQDAGDPALEVAVSGSMAAELDWVLHAAYQPAFRRDHATLGKLYADAPDLAERVRAFWGPEGDTECSGSMEMTILAHHGGLLFSLDAEELLGRIEELATTVPADLRLASETSEDRVALRARLAHLRESPAVRRGYAALVRDVWSAVEPDWRHNGLRSVQAAVAARREIQRHGGSWREIAHSSATPSQRQLDDLVAALPVGGMVAVVPAYFAHLGSLVDLPGTVLVGVRAEGSGAEARARTELLARRLKTISDPTRLAMIEVLRTGPTTVTELAELFSLAQPTVSNHIKILRDAGLVANSSIDGRHPLVLQPEAIRDLLEGVEGILVPPEPSGAH